MKNMLGSFTKHRHILHGGYTFAGTGAWALQVKHISLFLQYTYYLIFFLIERIADDITFTTLGWILYIRKLHKIV